MSKVDEEERKLAERDLLMEFEIMRIKLDLTRMLVVSENPDADTLERMLKTFINADLAPIPEWFGKTDA